MWNAINAIRAGLGLKSQTKVPMMKKPDGTKCTTSDESAEVFAEYFTGVFGDWCGVGIAVFFFVFFTDGAVAVTVGFKSYGDL